MKKFGICLVLCLALLICILPQQAEAATVEKSADSLFEDKLRMFMQRSESKMSDLRMQKDKRSGGRRRR